MNTEKQETVPEEVLKIRNLCHDSLEVDFSQDEISQRISDIEKVVKELDNIGDKAILASEFFRVSQDPSCPPKLREYLYIEIFRKFRVEPRELDRLRRRLAGKPEILVYEDFPETAMSEFLKIKPEREVDKDDLVSVQIQHYVFEYIYRTMEFPHDTKKRDYLENVWRNFIEEYPVSDERYNTSYRGKEINFGLAWYLAKFLNMEESYEDLEQVIEVQDRLIKKFDEFYEAKIKKLSDEDINMKEAIKWEILKETNIGKLVHYMVCTANNFSKEIGRTRIQELYEELRDRNLVNVTSFEIKVLY